MFIEIMVHERKKRCWGCRDSFPCGPARQTFIDGTKIRTMRRETGGTRITLDSGEDLWTIEDPRKIAELLNPPDLLPEILELRKQVDRLSYEMGIPKARV